ncbi:MAG: hypothetical protein E6Q76_06055 [Rhizobium sp.]|nr:MAG: hypothetical protein E6Q76_06055 [Rhizobium sp.]
MPVQPPFSHELLTDTRLQAKKIGPMYASMRGEHLQELAAVEALVREAAPLAISYDVHRAQAPYFHEFTYTECLGGGLLVSPQSVEVSARMVQMALDQSDQGFDAAPAILEQRQQRGTLDKYRLNESTSPGPKAVAFIPGSNCFSEMVSREVLARAMADDPGMVIKPHPMSDGELVAGLVRDFGYYRILDPRESGDACLMDAETVYATTTTEMGLYAVLMGKPVHNIGNFFNEGRGTYSAFYRPLWGKTPADAGATLRKALNSPYGGFFHKDDPNLPDRIDRYFKAVMTVREVMKPLIWTPPPPMLNRAQPPANK